MKTKVPVCAAVIRKEGKYLLARRRIHSHLGGEWEFPGGKINSGESGGECILRELREELGVAAEVEQFLTTVEHYYPEKAVSLHFYLCRVPQGLSLNVREHEAVGWFTISQIMDLNIAEADKLFVSSFLQYNHTKICR